MTVGAIQYEIKLDQKKMRSNIKKNLNESGKEINKWSKKEGKHAGETLGEGIGKNTTSALKKSESGMKKWAKNIGKLVGGMIAYGAFNVVKDGWAEFAASTRQLEALTKGKANIEEITKTARKMSSVFGTEAKDSVNSFYQAISAGFSEKESHGLIEWANKMAAAGTASGDNLNVKSSLNALTTVLNAFNIKASESKRVADAFTNAIAYGKTSVNKLAETISTVAPISSALGMSLEDVLVHLSALTQSGFSTETAFVGMRQMLNEMSNSSRDAGKALQTNLGMGLAEALQKGMTFTEIMQKGLMPSVKGVSANLINLFGNIRASAAAMALANNDFKLATRIQNKFKESVDSTNKATQVFTKSAITKFKAGVESIKNAIINIVNSLGGLHNIIKFVGAALAAFSVGNLIAKLAGVATAYAGVAAAKTAAMTGPGAIAAIPAVMAAIGAGVVAGGAIFGAYKVFNSFDSAGKGTNIINENNNNWTPNITVNVDQNGATAISNGNKYNVQTNFGG